MIAAIADTHAVIWYVFSDRQLSSKARAVFENASVNGNLIGVSSITLVEIVYLIEKQRVPMETLTGIAALLGNTSSVLTEIPVDLSIARALSLVDITQVPDMPDRIIAATAVHHRVPIISRDGKIKLSAIQTIW
jgi:PIN domain nuclease of toxin-antitoxin system